VGGVVAGIILGSIVGGGVSAGIAAEDEENSEGDILKAGAIGTAIGGASGGVGGYLAGPAAGTLAGPATSTAVQTGTQTATQGITQAAVQAAPVAGQLPAGAGVLAPTATSATSTSPLLAPAAGSGVLTPTATGTASGVLTGQAAVDAINQAAAQGPTIRAEGSGSILSSKGEDFLASALISGTSTGLQLGLAPSVPSPQAPEKNPSRARRPSRPQGIAANILSGGRSRTLGGGGGIGRRTLGGAA